MKILTIGATCFNAGSLMDILPRLQAAAGKGTSLLSCTSCLLMLRHPLEGEGESSGSSGIGQEGTKAFVYTQRDVILYALSSEFKVQMMCSLQAIEPLSLSLSLSLPPQLAVPSVRLTPQT